MLKSRNLPDIDRLSVLAATILLAYALSRFIDLPVQDLSVQLPGIFLPLKLDIGTLVAFLVAGLTASGAEWLLHDHPRLQGRRTYQHWLLPSMTALVLGVSLSPLPMGGLWWAIFAIGGVLLMLVLTAEYIVVDPEDFRFQPAAIGLTAVAFTLYLILAITLDAIGLRLYLLLPALMFAAGLVSLRTLRLRHGEWRFFESLVIALVVGQISAALHYWPLSAVTYGLLSLAPAYALTSLVAGLEEGQPLRKSLVEPALVLGVILGVALWMH